MKYFIEGQIQQDIKFNVEKFNVEKDFENHIFFKIKVNKPSKM